MSQQKTQQPVFIVDSDGELLSAVGVGKDNVTFHGSPDKVAKARFAADQEEPIDFIWGVRSFITGWETEEGILASLLAVSPGRTYIKEAPEGIMNLIHSLAGDHNHGEVN